MWYGLSPIASALSDGQLEAIKVQKSAELSFAPAVS